MFTACIHQSRLANQLRCETIPLMYPVGIPIIEVHDSDYFPCNLHFQTPSCICSCSLKTKMKYVPKKTFVDIITPSVFDLHHYISTFDGIIMVDVVPPSNMYHPLLPVYDHARRKCLYSCQSIIRGTFPSPVLKVAVKHGYILTKNYRADRYKLMHSK
jgi:hypothetical protein